MEIKYLGCLKFTYSFKISKYSDITPIRVRGRLATEAALPNSADIQEGVGEGLVSGDSRWSASSSLYTNIGATTILPTSSLIL